MRCLQYGNSPYPCILISQRWMLSRYILHFMGGGSPKAGLGTGTLRSLPRVGSRYEFNVTEPLKGPPKATNSINIAAASDDNNACFKLVINYLRGLRDGNELSSNSLVPHQTWS